MSRMGTIRCLKCNKDVLKKFNPSNPLLNYSVTDFYVGSTHGCICSECIKNTDFFKKYTIYLDELDDKDDYDTDNEIDYENQLNSNLLMCIEKKFSVLNKSLIAYENEVKKTVFGQDKAIRSVLYSIYANQYANMIEELGILPKTDDGFEYEIKKKHILLIGDTGVGKTLLVRTVAKIMQIPYIIANATPITASGYVGEDVSDIVERLYHAANDDIVAAENGIVVIDEIDKKRRTTSHSNKDVNGEAVQQELLKLLEPSTIWISKGKIPFKTDNLTVIMMGAFVGLDDVIKKRITPNSIGFASPNIVNEKDYEVTEKDLVQYGFIPEFIGRIKTICTLNKLSLDVVIHIIRKTIREYETILNSKGIELSFSNSLIKKIAIQALESSTGARAVDKIVNKLMEPIMWNIYQCDVINGTCYINEDGSSYIKSNNNSKNEFKSIYKTPPIDDYVEKKLATM